MSSQTAHPVLTRRIRELLQSEDAKTDLEAYFAESTDPDAGNAGRHFERLAGGGDRADRAHVITAEDLIAVQTISVTVKHKTSVQLLEGHLGLEVSRHLRDIPTDVSLLDPRAATLIAPGSPADQCWQLLVSNDAPGIGWVTAGKLLARKRPHLIPVYDEVLSCALGRPNNYWTDLQHALVDDEALRNILTDLHARAPRHVTHLRVLDVVIWMSHKDEHRNVCKAGSAGDDEEPYDDEDV